LRRRWLYAGIGSFIVTVVLLLTILFPVFDKESLWTKLTNVEPKDIIFPAISSDTLYEYYDTGDNLANLMFTTYWNAQTFTIGTVGDDENHDITSVKLLLYRKATPGTITVSIRAVDGAGKPTGADLTSGTTNGDSLTTDTAGEWREISLTSYELEAGTTYAIVARSQGTGLSDSAGWRLDTTGGYTGGTDVTSSNSGSTWTVNSAYDFLFYESEQPDVWQMDKGWIIRKTESERFFTENLSKYGFNGREIKDFIDYWIPRLKDYEYYEIYPQGKNIIDTVIALEFSETPDAVLRLFYLIKGTNSATNSNIITPADNIQFKRTGFCVTEWGVILK